jgi:hypothetical protein
MLNLFQYLIIFSVDFLTAPETILRQAQYGSSGRIQNASTHFFPLEFV